VEVFLLKFVANRGNGIETPFHVEQRLQLYQLMETVKNEVNSFDSSATSSNVDLRFR
jgi:hypothetical protein